MRQEKVEEFIEKYGPEGNWAWFFRGSNGYIRTELVRDVSDHLRFLTLDVWKTEADFNDFRERHLAEYKRLDREFEGLTERETRLGAFWQSNE